MYHIAPDFVDRLREDGYDVWTISLWEKWLAKMPELESAISQIELAFEGLTLGDGIGLREANAIDGYATDSERAAQRKLDEKHDWRNIDSESLNQYYVAPTYFDARGFLFHLPAFLLAELNGQFDWEFVDCLIEKHPLSADWITLLDDSKANAIMNVLELLKHHPEYYDQTAKIDRAIQRIRDGQIYSGG